MPRTTLTDDEVETLLALIDAAEGAGVWPTIEGWMQANFDIEDPEKALDELREAVQ